MRATYRSKHWVTQYDGSKLSVTYDKTQPSGAEYELVTVTQEKRDTTKDDKREFLHAQKTNGILFRPHSVSKKIVTITPKSMKAHFKTPLRPEYPYNPVTHWIDEYVNFDYLGMYGLPPKLMSGYDNAYNLGELKTLALAEANKREMDILTSLAEMPETFKMFLDLAKALVKPRQTALRLFKEYQKAARKGRVEVGVKATDHLTSAWLQYRYGIMPVYYLMGDIRAQFDRDAKLFQSTRKVSRGNMENSITRDVAVNGFRSISLNYEVEGTMKLDALIKRLYSLDSLQSKRFGFNPVATMWELTFLSFVVDWAIQIGDTITALTPTCAEVEANASISKEQYKIVCSVIGYKPNDHTVVQCDTGTFAVIDYSAYMRTVGSGTPSFKIPVGLQKNLKRSIDAFALSWPLIRRALTKGK